MSSSTSNSGSNEGRGATTTTVYVEDVGQGEGQDLLTASESQQATNLILEAAEVTQSAAPQEILVVAGPSTSTSAQEFVAVEDSTSSLPPPGAFEHESLRVGEIFFGQEAQAEDGGSLYDPAMESAAHSMGELRHS